MQDVHCSQLIFALGGKGGVLREARKTLLNHSMRNVIISVTPSIVRGWKMSLLSIKRVLIVRSETKQLHTRP